MYHYGILAFRLLTENSKDAIKELEARTIISINTTSVRALEDIKNEAKEAIREIKDMAKEVRGTANKAIDEIEKSRREIQKAIRNDINQFFQEKSSSITAFIWFMGIAQVIQMVILSIRMVLKWA
jgi:formate dehydrogenase maturation protein FdhE